MAFFLGLELKKRIIKYILSRILGYILFMMIDYICKGGKYERI